jgi:hypothetical protein
LNEEKGEEEDNAEVNHLKSTEKSYIKSDGSVDELTEKSSLKQWV